MRMDGWMIEGDREGMEKEKKRGNNWLTPDGIRYTKEYDIVSIFVH